MTLNKLFKNEKGLGIFVMILLSISIIITVYLTSDKMSVLPDNIYDHNLCEEYGWQMDTIYNVDSSRFIVTLHYYQEIEYKIDTIEVIQEDGIRWYTLDTIIYDR